VFQPKVVEYPGFHPLVQTVQLDCVGKLVHEDVVRAVVGVGAVAQDVVIEDARPLATGAC